MANTRSSAKRARQAVKRQASNSIVSSGAKTAIRNAIAAIQTKDLAKAKEAYMTAVKTLSKAASKKSLPKTRAARKISRLTLLIKKTLPQVLSQ